MTDTAHADNEFSGTCPTCHQAYAGRTLEQLRKALGEIEQWNCLGLDTHHTRGMQQAARAARLNDVPPTVVSF